MSSTGRQAPTICVLEQDYELTPSEIAMVLGSSVEYTISEVADRNTGVVAIAEEGSAHLQVTQQSKDPTILARVSD